MSYPQGIGMLEFLEGEIMATQFETTYILPSFWASAFFNNDTSGMKKNDIESINNWLKANPLSLAEGHWSLVEDEEPFYVKSHDAKGYVLACDCLTYVWNQREGNNISFFYF